MNSYSETQRFRQAWVWVVFVLLLLLNVFNFWYKPSNIELYKSLYPDSFLAKFDELLFYIKVVGVILAAGYILLFGLFTLRTTVNEAGVSYQFFPMQFNLVKKGWGEIEKAYVRQYRRAKGGPVKYFVNDGRTYSIAGIMGLQLVFKNGDRVLVGTQQPQALKATLQALADQGKISRSVMDTTGEPI